MPKRAKGKQKERKKDKRNRLEKRRTKARKTKFIFGRELSIDQIVAGLKQMCEEAGIPFVEERKK